VFINKIIYFNILMCKQNILMYKQREQEIKYIKLIDQGHTCVCVFESYPMQIIWCRRDICINL
jgi:hypothetical protein